MLLRLGGILFDILHVCKLVELNYESFRVDFKIKKVSIVVIPDKIVKLFPQNQNFVLPLKLPMLVEPKHYDNKNSFGGYFFNEIFNTNTIFIKKNLYKTNSRR